MVLVGGAVVVTGNSFLRRALDHGVDVVLDVVAGVPHVFPTFHGSLTEADEVLDRIALFLRQRLG
ncbi:hypothetical protein [Curtobacterium luteum]|uniref:hypothetical protein n=1 Tax=Curtobacterium luteum TaxID=33881 RepID=UPI003821C64D